jgi:ComF family protein
MWNDFLHLFYPEFCTGCGRCLAESEKHLCLYCYRQLPLVGDDLLFEERLAHRFAGRVKIEQTWSWLKFRPDGIAEKILYGLKYGGESELGLYMGEKMGAAYELKAFAKPDLIIPVPLHKQRLKERGYNQSERLASGMGGLMGIPVEDNMLLRVRSGSSLTNMSRLQRFSALVDQYKLEISTSLEDLHVMLVDDVITSGATLEACAALLRQRGARVTLASLAARV